MKNKIKVNDTVEFKASSLGSGTIIKLPNEEMYGDKLYTVEFPGGKEIRCTEHYFKTGSK